MGRGLKETVTAILFDGTESKVSAGNITLDDSWSPYLQGTVTIPTPDDLSTIDPLNGSRLRVQVYQAFNEEKTLAAVTALYGGSVAAMTAAFGGHPLADLSTAFGGTTINVDDPYKMPYLREFRGGIRTRTINRDGTTTLTIASDEALLQDWQILVTTGTPWYRLREALTDILTNYVVFVGKSIKGSADLSLAAATATAGGVIDWDPGTSAWDFLSPFIESAQARLWSDELGAWHLDYTPFVYPGFVGVQYGGDLTDFEKTTSRDNPDWATAVTITYLNRDGTPSGFYDSADSGDLPRKVLHVEVKAPFPGPGASQAKLDRAMKRSTLLPITAISDYTANPGMGISVALEDEILTGVVQAVTWDFETQKMNVTTRDLS